MFRLFLKILSYNILIFLFLYKITYGEIINKIQIIGNERVPDETIKMLSNVEINSEISQKEINNIIKSLYETNFFENIEVTFSKNILKILIKENPIISSIKIKGIKAKRIKK